MICPKCGSEISDNQNFCNSCGAEIKNKKLSLTVIISVVVAAILLIGSIIGVKIYKNNQEKNQINIETEESQINADNEDSDINSDTKEENASADSDVNQDIEDNTTISETAQEKLPSTEEEESSASGEEDSASIEEDIFEPDYTFIPESAREIYLNSSPILTAEEKKIYLNLVQNYNSEHAKDSGSYAPAPTYDLIYFDDDSRPELLMDVQGYYFSLYTIKDGAPIPYIDIYAYGAGGNAGYDYLPRERLLHFTDSDYAGAIIYSNFLRFGITYDPPYVADCVTAASEETSFVISGSGSEFETDFDNPTITYHSDYLANDKESKRIYEDHCESLDSYLPVLGSMSYDEICNILTSGSSEPVSYNISDLTGAYSSASIGETVAGFENYIYLQLYFKDDVLLSNGVISRDWYWGSIDGDAPDEEVTIKDNHLEFMITPASDDRLVTLEVTPEGNLIYTDLCYDHVVLVKQ